MSMVKMMADGRLVLMRNGGEGRLMRDSWRTDLLFRKHSDPQIGR